MTELRQDDWEWFFGENKNLADSWRVCVCVCILQRKGKTAALPGNPACWCQCGQRTACTLRSARVNHQTTATTQEAKPVNNGSMTIWKAAGFWCSLLAFWSQPQVNQYLTWTCFGFRSPQLSLPWCYKSQLWSDSCTEAKKGQIHHGSRRAPASPCDPSKTHRCSLSHTPVQTCRGVVGHRRSSSSCHSVGGRLCPVMIVKVT